MKTWIDKAKELDGFDVIVIPLVFFEALVVNFLMNAGLNVPDRVSLNKLAQANETNG